MNIDQTQAVAAIVLSIAMHAAFGLADFRFGKTGAEAGKLAVIVVSTADARSDQPEQNTPVESTPAPPEVAEEIVPPPVAEVPPTVEPVVEPRPTPLKPILTAKPKARPSAKLAQPARTLSKKSEPTPEPGTAPSSQPKPAGTAGDTSLLASLQLPVKPEVSAIPLYHLIPKPLYPSRSRDHGEAGTVIVAILVGVDGRVSEASISESSGYPLLDGSALLTVKEKWRFKPAMSGGRAVASWVRVPIRFNIKSRY